MAQGSNSDAPISPPRLGQAVDAALESLRRFGPDLALAWTGGKDSTLVLWAYRLACGRAGLPLPEVVFVDEGDVFPEVRDFVRDLSGQWGFKPVVLANRDLLDKAPEVGGTLDVAGLNQANRDELAKLFFTEPALAYEPDAPVLSHLLKTVPLARHIRESGLKALATGIRRDEHPARAGETAFSPRFDPDHVRVHPILELSEADVWEAVFAQRVPFCPLYARGYRSLGTASGTAPAGGVPAWEQTTDTNERAGRSLDKERAMAWLRDLGYM